MNQLIIVEGPDRVGKTSIVDLLKSAMPDPAVLKYSGTQLTGQAGHDHQERIFRHSFTEADELMNQGKTVIMDRSYIGEYVYSKYFGRPEPAYLPDLHREFQRLEPLYVYVTGPACGFLDVTDMYLERYRNEINGRFLSFFARNLPCNFLGVNNENFLDRTKRDQWVVSNVKGEFPKPVLLAGTVHLPHPPVPACSAAEPHGHEFWKHQQALSIWHAAPVVAVSPPEFKYAMFGEAPGEHGCGLTHIPFYHDRSGSLLRRAFAATGHNLDLFYMSNVFHNVPYNNKIFDYTSKEELAAVDFNDLSGLKPWLRYEMQMFRHEAIMASQAMKVFAAGRTAELMLGNINGQLGLKMGIVAMRHPASFLYKNTPEQEVMAYYREMVSV